jgi:hypothetical protein
MIRLTNKEIAQVFAQYPNARFVEQIGNSAIGAGPAWHIVWSYMEDDGDNLSNYKLELTTLEKISDEHAIEVARIALGNFLATVQWGLHYVHRCILKCGLSQDKIEFLKQNIDPWKHPQINDYLKSKCYAVPLFFSIGHAANYKTAIELGIAQDKTLQIA